MTTTPTPHHPRRCSFSDVIDANVLAFELIVVPINVDNWHWVLGSSAEKAAEREQTEKLRWFASRLWAGEKTRRSGAKPTQ